MRRPVILPRLCLAPNWRRLHRSFTVMLSMLLTLLAAAQDQWPLLQSFISPQRFAKVAFALGIAIAVLRYVEQKSLRAPPESTK
jgi:hypothetical protein